MKYAFLLSLLFSCTTLLQAQIVSLDANVEELQNSNFPKGTFEQNGLPYEQTMLAGKQSKTSKFMFGLRAGAATSNVDADELTFENSGRQFKIVADNKEFSYHLGLYAQARLNHWVIQPEVLFRSARSDYMLSEFVSSDFITSIRTEKYAYVDVPLMLAYRVGALRLQAGPVAKFYIDSSTELIGIAEFSDSYQKVDFGYQAGVGLDIWRFIVDLKYDRDVDQVGDHISFGGESLDFGTQAGRFLFSVGYSFVKP